MKSKKKIQIIETVTTQEAKFCLFCGKKIITNSGFRKCPHLLFVATSEGGIEFVSPLVKEKLSENKDTYTQLKNLPYPDSFMIVDSQPPPAMIELYIGLTPLLWGE